MLKMNFWRFVKEYAERKEQECWIKKYHCDQKCPHCNTWQGNCGGWKLVKQNHPTTQHDTCTCGKCGQETTFLDIGVGFIAVDPVTLERI